MENSYLGFDRKQMHFLIPIEYVRRIEGYQSGQKTLNNSQIADFRSDTNSREAMIIYLQIHDQEMGLLVDMVEGVTDMAGGQLFQLPALLCCKETEYIKNLVVFEEKRRIAILLDLEVFYRIRKEKMQQA